MLYNSDFETLTRAAKCRPTALIETSPRVNPPARLYPACLLPRLPCSALLCAHLLAVLTHAAGGYSFAFYLAPLHALAQVDPNVTLPLEAGEITIRKEKSKKEKIIAKKRKAKLWCSCPLCSRRGKWLCVEGAE